MEPKLLTAERFIDMRTGCSYRYVISETEYFRPHYHNYYEIFVMLDGTAIHCVNGERIRLVKGTVVFIRPHDTHDYVCENGKSFSMLNITFTSETADSLFAFLNTGFPSKELLNCRMPPSVVLSGSDFNWFTNRMGSIRTIGTDDFKSAGTALRIVIFQIFTKYFSSFADKEISMPGWLEELMEKIKQDGNYIAGSKKLFSLTDKTREHVSRSIKKYTGMTVAEYINDLRLHYIANMLLNSNHRITDIVFDSGFNNISWASELFKKHYGMTMSEFRVKNEQ